MASAFASVFTDAFFLKSAADKDDQIFQQFFDRLPLSNGANRNFREGILSFAPKQKPTVFVF